MNRDGKPLLLVVDTEAGQRGLCFAVASSLGFQVVEAGSGQAAVLSFQKKQPDVVLLDPNLPDAAGYALLSQWKTVSPSVPVAIMAADGSFDSLVQAMRLGACDYLSKPLDPGQLRLMLQRIQKKLPTPEEADAALLSAATIFPGATPGSATRLSEIERATIERVFQQVNGDKIMAGKLLGISRATLYRKLKRYQIRENSGRVQQRLSGPVNRHS